MLPSILLLRELMLESTYIFFAHSVENTYWVDEALRRMMTDEFSNENNSSAFEANERDS